MRKFAMAALIAVLFTAVTAQGVLAAPNTVTGDVTGTPACNQQTGDFEGSFAVTWSVTQNADAGYTITNTDPSTPQAAQYPAEDAGSSQSFSFTLTQTKYYTEDVYGDWYWEYYSPVPRIPVVTGLYLPFIGWRYHAVILWLPGVTGEFKRDKIHAVGDVEHQQSQEFSGGVSLELGDCDKEVTSSAPTFVDPTCADGTVGLTVPDDEGVLYSTEGSVEPGSSVTITASAEEGYVLSEESQTEWEHTYPAKAAGCTPPPPGRNCTFVGADKDGGTDKFGGTNDECAPRPDKPATPDSTPPAVSAPVVVSPPVVSTPAAEKPKAKAKAKKPKAKAKKPKAKAKKKPKASSRTVKAGKTPQKATQSF